MTDPALEQRLRAAMGDSHDSRWSPPDPTVLATIRERAAADTRPGRSVHLQPHQPKQAMVLAAAVVAVVVAAAAVRLWAAAATSAQLQAGTPGEGPHPTVVWPDPLSWWWLAGLGMVAALIVWAVGRLGDHLVTTAAACAVLGVISGAILVFPGARAGAELARKAPEIRGFELVEVRPVLWPNRHEYDVATLHYRSADPIPTDTSVEVMADEIGFNDLSPGTSTLARTERCRDLDLTFGAGDRRPDQELFCMTDVHPDGVTVAAVLWRSGIGPTVPRLVTYPLLSMAVLLLAVRVLSRRHDDRYYRHPVARHFFFALSLLLFSGALFLVGLPVYDLARTDRVISAVECLNGDSCRDQLTAALQGSGVERSALRIYSLIYLIGDAAALILAVVGWTFTLAGHPSRRRVLLLVGLTAIGTILVIAAPVLYGDTLEVMSLYND